jgi:3-dehydroquinate dehydratase
MDVLHAVLVELAKLDQHWTAKLRADSFENDRTRNQGVGRIKAIDEIKGIVVEIRKKQSGGEVEEEETKQ